MQTRELGSTGIALSVVGFGAWGIGSGWGATSETESRAALDHALASGLTFIDTAWMYGDGRSERLVGDAVRAADSAPVVATKVPPANRLWPADDGVPTDKALPPGHLRRYTEESLSRLGLDHVDLQQLHCWSPRWLHEGSWQDEVATLKSDGLIRAFGVSVNDHQPDTAVELVESGLVDSVQVIYNIFDQTAEDGLFAACLRHGVGVVVRVPLDEGGLTGAIRPDTTFATDDWRSSYFRGDRPAQVASRVAALTADLGIAQDEVARLALQFVLSHPAVTSVIPGMRRVVNVDRNLAVADLPPLTDDQLAVLRRHRWDRNFYA